MLDSAVQQHIWSCAAHLVLFVDNGPHPEPSIRVGSVTLTPPQNNYFFVLANLKGMNLLYLITIQIAWMDVVPLPSSKYI